MEYSITASDIAKRIGCDRQDIFFGKLCAPDQERVLCRNYRSSVELEERY